MFEDFDGLFDNLFNQRKIKNLESLNEFMSKFKFKNEDELNKTEPTSTRLYKKNGYTFQESVWETELGRIVKVELVSKPNETVNNDNLSLESKLELAIQEERYEDAAKLRDEIKKEKMQPSNSEAVESNDDWNF